MSLKWLGIPDFCKHGHYEDKCEICILERRIEILEKAVVCTHQWEEGRNGLPAVFFNGTNAYTRCAKCRQRKAC